MCRPVDADRLVRRTSSDGRRRRCRYARSVRGTLYQRLPRPGQLDCRGVVRSRSLVGTDVSDASVPHGGGTAAVWCAVRLQLWDWVLLGVYLNNAAGMHAGVSPGIHYQPVGRLQRRDGSELSI